MKLIGMIIAAVVGILVGCLLGFTYRKRIAEKEIGGAEEEAKRIINESIKTAESKKREAVLEAKEEIHKSRADLDREIKERRSEIQKSERRLQQKEETLDRKIDANDQKNEELSRRLARVQKTHDEAEKIKAEQIARLEEISGLSREEAKDYLVSSIEAEAQHDAAVKLREINQNLKDEAEMQARKIITSAIQRCAADHVAEATVSVVPLPNDEM